MLEKLTRECTTKVSKVKKYTAKSSSNDVILMVLVVYTAQSFNTDIIPMAVVV